MYRWAMAQLSHIRSEVIQFELVYHDSGRQLTMGETKHERLDRISVDPNVCFGKPCVKGHRIWVSLVLDAWPSSNRRLRPGPA